MAEFDLLKKTELRIENILLQGANLTEIAAVVADTLKIECNSVLVTDVQHDSLTIDILKGTVDVYNIIAKRDELFKRLAMLSGGNQQRSSL